LISYRIDVNIIFEKSKYKKNKKIKNQNKKQNGQKVKVQNNRNKIPKWNWVTWGSSNWIENYKKVRL